MLPYAKMFDGVSAGGLLVTILISDLVADRLPRATPEVGQVDERATLRAQTATKY